MPAQIVNPIQTNFTAGEISPKAYGHVDLSRYSNAVKTAINFIVQPQGGFYRRSGTKYVNTAVGTGNEKLVEFIFSQQQAYVIELSNELATFYRNGALLVNGGSPVTVATPYLSADIPSITYLQQADTLYLFHQKYPPASIARTSDTSWQYNVLTFTNGPYQDMNTVGTNFQPTGTMTPSGTSGTVTVTASFNAFVSTDVGRHLQMLQGSTWGWGKIASYVSATQVTVTTVIAFGSTAAATQWALGAIGATNGYPAVACFYDQRLVMANTPVQPQTFFMSVTSSYYDYSPTNAGTTTVLDSNSVVYTLASNQVNGIAWMLAAAQNLLIGTIGAEWRIESGASTSSVTPTSIQAIPQTTYGSMPGVRAFHIGYSIVYAQRSQRRFREMTYQFAVDGFVSTDISLMGEHLFRLGNGLVDIAYASEPDSVIWFVRGDGNLIGFTYLKDEGVLGFSQHIFGPSLAGPCVVKSIACIPSPDGTQDQLWLLTQRTINGNLVQYVEYLEVPFDPGTSTTTSGSTVASNAYFVDCGLSVLGLSTATNTVSGLNQLIGETVSIIADGSKRTPATVNSSGSVTFDGDPAKNISVGLACPAYLTGLYMETGSDKETSQGKTKRTKRNTFRFLNTLGFDYSADGNTWYTQSFRDTSDPMDAAPPLQSSDIRLAAENTYDFYGNWYIRQMDPYPMTLLAVMPETKVVNNV